MKKLFKRLRSNAGETLIEALAAILVFTFSSIILLSMISSATRINKTANEVAQMNQEQMIYAEKGPDAEGSATETGTVRVTLDGDVIASIPVDVYRLPGEADAFYSYFKQGS